jgi:hypothetical protein
MGAAQRGKNSFIGVAVGIDIDPDTDIDSDTECAGLLNDDISLALQVKHTRNHSLQTPGSVKHLLLPRQSRDLSTD